MPRYYRCANIGVATHQGGAASAGQKFRRMAALCFSAHLTRGCSLERPRRGEAPRSVLEVPFTMVASSRLRRRAHSTPPTPTAWCATRRLRGPGDPPTRVTVRFTVNVAVGGLAPAALTFTTAGVAPDSVQRRAAFAASASDAGALQLADSATVSQPDAPIEYAPTDPETPESVPPPTYLTSTEPDAAAPAVAVSVTVLGLNPIFGLGDVELRRAAKTNNIPMTHAVDLHRTPARSAAPWAGFYRPLRRGRAPDDAGWLLAVDRRAGTSPISPPRVEPDLCVGKALTRAAAQCPSAGALRFASPRRASAGAASHGRCDRGALPIRTRCRIPLSRSAPQRAVPWQ